MSGDDQFDFHQQRTVGSAYMYLRITNYKNMRFKKQNNKNALKNIYI